MAHTQVTISNDNGVLMPSQASVPVAEGDSVAFSSADGSAVTLCFSPDAARILSPDTSGTVNIPVGGSSTFIFTSSQPGAYSVLFSQNASANPGDYPSEISGELLLGVGLNRLKGVDLDQFGFSVAPTGGPRTG